MIYAIYRCLYGEDFIEASIRSIAPFVDLIIVFYDDTPWGDVEGVWYKGEWIEFNYPFDSILSKLRGLQDEYIGKLHLIRDHVYDNRNQYTHFVNDIILPYYQRPDTLLCLEVDHVFVQRELKNALNEFQQKNMDYVMFDQIEHWKTPQWRIPWRPRTSATLWNVKNWITLPSTGRQADVQNGLRWNYRLHNMGFCFNAQTMLWKHLLALAFSRKISDSEPNETWYEEKWLNWKPETSCLEPAKGFEHRIPHAIPYFGKLPEGI